MAGLLDSLNYGNRGGYGGLLDMLMYQSPLNQPQEAPPQPQYDAMGNYTGITPQAAPSPFGLSPGFDPSIYAPQSPFTGGAPAVAGLSGGLPALPSQNIAPPPQVAPTVDAPQNPISVGNYQMPRIGNSTDFNSQMPTEMSAQRRQPQQVTQATQGPLPAALGGRPEGNLLDQINNGLQSIGNGGSLIGALTGNYTDDKAVKQQGLKAQYDALVPLLGQQKAMLAVMNPEAGKILLAQALEKKNYGFTKLDNDTVLRTDPQTGRVEVGYSSGNQTNTMQGPDGSIITMPQGADPKTWRNEITKINADVAAGKKTEVQAKSEKFGNKMENAERNLSGLQGQGSSLFGQIASNVPLGNYVQSDAFQKYNQAKNNFITALLRDESGAAIGTQEFQRYEKELFPQPGDSQSVIQQKAVARQAAIDGMKKSAGPGYKSPTAGPTGVRRYNPATGTIE